MTLYNITKGKHFLKLLQEFLDYTVTFVLVREELCDAIRITEK